ncbi:MAG: hypothetical protein K940chlam1_00796 [Candidatus Anoxychlamydiales bacterium]|nr:hypothetical protein [Candidatus Anoxychlamydiales bacterium]NGX36779.1 hypothetical protein [Candidatus Anoxychlamydiales bacterium]
MSDGTITSKNKFEPWSYKPDYKLTSKLLNSDRTIAKITKYTGVTLAVLAAAETIREIVKLPFKLVGNLFGLYKYAMFKAPIIEKSSKSHLRDLIEKTPGWKKALYATGGAAILGGAIYGGYKLYPSMPSIFSKAPERTTPPANTSKSKSFLTNLFAPTCDISEAPESTTPPANTSKSKSILSNLFSNQTCDTAREYTRGRSYWAAHQWLKLNEPRGQGFEHFWKKYNNDSKTVIEGAMKSNPKFDNPQYLQSVDRPFDKYSWNNLKKNFPFVRNNS